MSGAALVFVSILAIGAIPPTPDCKLAAEWAAANVDALPATRVEIQQFATPWRRAILNRLPASTRVTLWREHLTDALRTESLTHDQQSFVREAFENVERLFHLPRATAQSEIARQWEPRMHRLFPGERNQLAARIFYDLVADVDGNGRRPVVVRANVLPALSSSYIHSLVRSIAPTFAGQARDCDCRSDGECDILDCHDTSSCQPSETGCGWLDEQPCHGQCY
jgi:hypothetical protein